MRSRRSIAVTLGAMLLFPGGLAAQSLPAFDIPVPSISIDLSGLPDAPAFSSGADTAVQFNESDFDFVSRIAEEATSGISESVVNTLAAVQARLEEFAAQGLDPEEIDSVVDDLQGIVVLCVSGGTCEPPDPPPEP